MEVSATDYDQTVSTIIAAAHRRESALVTFLPVHGVVTAAGDQNYLYRVNAFDLVAPDGMPVRWAINYLHKLRMPDRVCGPEAMTRICRRAAQDGIRNLSLRFHSRHTRRAEEKPDRGDPELRIVGIDSPPFRELTDEENEQAVQRINDSGAGLVFIGLGCPRQDFFAYHNRNGVKAVQLGVGAAFDFHAGMLRRPPVWMQKWGLEWTYRLIQEPRRLWKRYMVTNTTFCWKGRDADHQRALTLRFPLPVLRERGSKLVLRNPVPTASAPTSDDAVSSAALTDNPLIPPGVGQILPPHASPGSCRWPTTASSGR